MSSRMNQCGIPVAGARRSAAGGACHQRPARMAVVDRRHADPVGQSGRRTRVRRRQRRCARDQRVSARPIRIGGRSRGSRAACRRMARSGWSGCKVLAPPPGGLATCGCSRLDFPDGSHGILIAAGNSCGPHHAAGRTAAAAGRGHRPADRGICARRHVDRRQRCRASAARLSQSLRGRPRRGAQRRVEAGPGRDIDRYRPYGAATRRQRRRYRPGRADSHPRPRSRAADTATPKRPPRSRCRRICRATRAASNRIHRRRRAKRARFAERAATRPSACRSHTGARAATRNIAASAAEAEIDPHEPSPYVEAVADEPSPRARQCARHGSTSRRRMRGGFRCASCGRWIRKAASRSAPTNSPA